MDLHFESHILLVSYNVLAEPFQILKLGISYLVARLTVTRLWEKKLD